MHKGRIVSVCNEKGERFENDQVAKKFVKHFQEFLGKKDVVTKMPKDGIVFPNKLSFKETVMMCKDVSEVEVKNGMFDIEDSKAPGPDGYTARFYKSAWSVIGKDICQALKEFFVNGKLLGEELFKGYYRKQKIKKVAFKIDLQEAYDTINWDFLRVVLEKFGFPKKMVKWIMVCVSTTKFSINMNGEREGYFSGGRGLRKGDPMPPYLFTLVMEAFNLIMRRNINNNKEFKYHQGSQKLGITHLCFADDLLVFCHEDHKSVNVIKKALVEFSSYSGLKANMSKSTVFFGGLTEAEQKRELTRGKAKDTIWVNWINKEYLKGKSVWLVSAKASSSAGWKDMLKLRDKVGKHILWKVGDGLNIDTTINELVNKYEGTWPEGWINQGPLISPSPAMVLDDSYIAEYDFSKHAMGKVRDVKSIPNLLTLLYDEGFMDIKAKYLGGLWVLFEFKNVETKANLLQHTGVNSWFHVIQYVIPDFVSNERIVWVDIEGVSLHVCEEEEEGEFNASNIEEVAETLFDDIAELPKSYSGNSKQKQSEDPFGLYDVLAKNKKVMEKCVVSPSLSHP
nr:hypothetical protein [Tanacetum cinerariifolium]